MRGPSLTYYTKHVVNSKITEINWFFPVRPTTKPEPLTLITSSKAYSRLSNDDESK